MLELLESVASEFPIGSILLWNVDRRILKIAPSETTAFPSVDEQFPANYVLDGMQRLSTLYGVFHFGTSTDNSMFDVSFNLEDGSFYHTADGGLFSDKSIPLSALFSPRSLLSHQSRLSSYSNGEELIDKLLALQARFQEYLIPVVTIRSTDVTRIVGIFEKINSTGTRLDPVDFMRAITWAEDFDLNMHLEHATETLSRVRFDIDPEAIIKCVGICLDIPPTTDGLLALRKSSPDDLRRSFADTISGLTKVAEFCANELRIYSAKSIPYEGQLLLLFKTIGREIAEPDEKPLIAKWFWATGFNESLRGKPDHYVARAVDNWRGLVRGHVRGLEPRLKLTSKELYERRIVSGGALSSTFAAMHAVRGSMNLYTGEIVPPELFMMDSGAAWFEPVFDKDELLESSVPADVSSRMFGNLTLVDRRHRYSSGIPLRAAIIQNALDRKWEVLDSNFISEAAAASLISGDIRGFVEQRATSMVEFAQQLVGA